MFDLRLSNLRGDNRLEEKQALAAAKAARDPWKKAKRYVRMQEEDGVPWCSAMTARVYVYMRRQCFQRLFVRRGGGLRFSSSGESLSVEESIYTVESGAVSRSFTSKESLRRPST